MLWAVLRCTRMFDRLFYLLVPRLASHDSLLTSRVSRVGSHVSHLMPALARSFLQYVWRQVMSETAAVLSGGTTVGGMSVGHWAHLGGAIGGVLLVLLLSRLPKGEGDDF